MESGPIAGATRNLSEPVDWDEKKSGSCGDLLIRDIKMWGGNVMASAWVPSKEELKKLNAGASVILYVMGRVHPPVSVQVSDAVSPIIKGF